MRPVVLSGGSGTRLWPLSNTANPKQFLPLLGRPLLLQALQRLDTVPGVLDPMIVTGAEHVDLLTRLLGEWGIERFRVLVEPVGRNTAPAIFAAALSVDPDETIVVLPADHLVADVGQFHESVLVAVDIAQNAPVVTFGVRPDRAETGYGYIELGAPITGGFEIARFVEKPEERHAAAMASSGKHLWNSGMFVFVAGSLLDVAREIAPGMVESVADALRPAAATIEPIGASFASIPPLSFDRAIMEKVQGAAVVPLDVGWSDIGSFHSLWAASPKDDDGNVLSGDVSVLDVTDSYILSTDRSLAVAGLRDVVVIETSDAVLVVGRDSAQMVRDLAQDAAPDE